jgi:hypothetical protein
MRTDDLIATLSAGATPVPRGLAWRRIGVACALALAAAFGVLMIGWGLRPDLHTAMRTPPFWMKAGYTSVLAVAGLLLLDRSGRPGARGGVGLALLIAAVAGIIFLTARELMLLPMSAWRADMMGATSWRCPIRITVLAAPAFALALWTLRRMAPTRPALAGAAAGLLAGGLGATVYGLYCQETAAAFTASWYTLGVAVWAAIGALVGPRLLRW